MHEKFFKISVSETIRKEPLAEAQTALGKQKIRSVERRYLPHYRNSVKNCFLTQNFTVIGQLAAELWPKTIFKTAAVRHLEFPKFSYLVTLLLPSFKFTKFHRNRVMFRWDMAISWFSRWRISAILNFMGSITGSLKAHVGRPIGRQ